MHRLALELGRTVEQLGDELTYTELLDWLDYYCVEPFGERRADLRNAVLCCLIANANRDPKKKDKPFEVKDFLLTREDLDTVVEKDEVPIAAAEVKAEVKGTKISSEVITGLFVLSAMGDGKKKKAKAK